MPRSLRTLGLGALVAVSTLTSCAADSSSSSTLVPMVVSTTAFATMPPATTTPTTMPGQTTTLPPGAPIDYQIKFGDFLYGIADAHGVSADDIVTLNGWSSVHHELEPGTTIKIPAPPAGAAGTASDPEPGDTQAPDGTPTSAASDPTDPGGDTSLPPDASDPSTPDGASTTSTATAGAGEDYEVKSNDTVYGLARKYGITPAELVELNGWSDVNHSLHPGDTILVPAGE